MKQGVPGNSDGGRSPWRRPMFRRRNTTNRRDGSGIPIRAKLLDLPFRLAEEQDMAERRRLLARARKGDPAALREFQVRWRCRLLVLDGKVVQSDA